MEILHFSDTHLGYSEYSTLDSTGINQREADVYQAFVQVIDRIIELKPVVAIHSGDLFDNVRPSNRAINMAMTQFRRLSDAGIPLVVIAGNHSAPKIRTTGSIFQALAQLKGIFPVYDGEYKVVRIGEIVIHGISDSPTVEQLEDNLRRVKSVEDARFNVIAIHAGNSRAQAVITSGEFNQHVVPHEAFLRLKNFDYIALGHYHKFMQVEGISNAYYSGATERFSFSEANYSPGFVMVDLEKKSVKHVSIPVRNMVIFDPVDCRGKSAGEILHELEDTLKDRIDEKIVKIRLENISAQTRTMLDWSQLREIARKAVYFFPEIVVSKGEAGETATTAIGDIHSEFERFMAKYGEVKGLDKQKLKQLGTEFLSQTFQEQQAKGYEV